MSPALSPQRRSRRVAMTAVERDSFLAEQRTCRVATMGPNGPHATPLWFTWDGAALWVTSLVRSQRWADVVRDPRIAVVIDTGVGYDELRGVEISGRAEVVGPAPRTDDAHDADGELRPVEQAFARRYLGTDEMVHDGRHGWLKIVPEKIVSWDFRKIAG